MNTPPSIPSYTYEDVLGLLAETQRIIQETSQRQKETDRLLKTQAREAELRFKKLEKNLGRLGNRLGEFVEEMVRPAVLRLFQKWGLDVHSLFHDVSIKGEHALEIDLLAVNDGDLVAVECKSKLTCEDVDAHLQRLLRLKHALPVYAQHRVFGAVAAMVTADAVAQYAETRGLFVLVQSGEQVVLRNAVRFRPHDWSVPMENHGRG